VSTDMTGRKVREPGKAGERYREARERRAQASLQRKRDFWADRIKQAQTPLDVYRVMTNRVHSAVVQRERQAAIAAERATGTPDARQAAARLDEARRAIAADLLLLAEQMEAIAQRHETHRV
jgi:hypothetical protein